MKTFVVGSLPQGDCRLVISKRISDPVIKKSRSKNAEPMHAGYQIRNQTGIYFVTFAVVQWVDVFTRREYAQVVIDSLNFCTKEKGLIVYSWCLMSNHLHLIFSTQQEVALSDVLRDFKKFTSSRILKAISENPQESRRNWMLWIFKSVGKSNNKNTHYQFWQQDNHPMELSSNAFKDQKLEYIHQNPVTAGLVYRPDHYVYSSAIDYAGGKGLVEVSVL